MVDLRPERTHLNSERHDFRPERPDLGPEMPDLKPRRPKSKPERPYRGGTNGQLDGPKKVPPPVLYRTLSPLEPLPKSLVTMTDMKS